MLDVIGSGFNTAYIYDRLGRTRLLPLPRAQKIEWGRALSDVSTTTVEIAAQDCTPKLDQVHAFGCSVVVFRQSGSGPAKRVWEGPVRKIKSKPRGGLTIEATDVIGLTDRRRIRAARLLAGTPVRDELVWTITQAFTPDDPNVLAHVQVTGTAGDLIDRDVAVGSGMHLADLGTLTNAGGRYTALGRRIILFTAYDNLGRTKSLRPEDHLTDDVEIIEDGDDLMTSAWARDDSGNVGEYDVDVDGVDDYYGRVDGLLSSGSDEEGVASLTNRAEFAVRSNYPARQIITVPDGAALQCDAPFPIETLVPGTLIPVVTSTATGRRISATMMLAQVKVTQDANSNEKVGITLVPVPSGV